MKLFWTNFLRLPSHNAEKAALSPALDVQQTENEALYLFKYTLARQMVRKIRFDSVGDFKITLEFHSASESCRDIRGGGEGEDGTETLN